MIGKLNSVNLPVCLRKPCFYSYSWIFDCNLKEIEANDICQFKNLSEFFRRSLKPNVRVIDEKCCIVSNFD